MKNGNENKVILAIFLGSLLLRILVVTFFNINQSIPDGQTTILKSDQLEYWQFAETFLKDSSWMTKHVSTRPPFYPLFLAFVTFLFGTGKGFINIMLAQSFISSLSVIIIFYIAKRAFNSQIALWSALWAAVYPVALSHSGLIYRENLVIFIFLLFTLYLFKYIEKQKAIIILFVGFLYALLIHTDARFIFHLPFLLLYLYMGLRSVRLTSKAYAIFVIIALLFSLPWGIRNKIVYKDTFVFISTRTQSLDRTDSKLLKSDPKKLKMESREKNGEFHVKKPDTLEKFEEVKKRAIENYYINKKLAKIQLDSYDKIHSEDEITAFNNGARPQFKILDIYLSRFIEFWRIAKFKPGYRPYPDLRFDSKWSTAHNAVNIIFFGALIPFFIIGLYFCIKEGKKYGILLSSIIFFHTLLHVIVHARERYRMPIEPFVVMIACFGIAMSINKFKTSIKVKRIS